MKTEVRLTKRKWFLLIVTIFAVFSILGCFDSENSDDDEPGITDNPGTNNPDTTDNPGTNDPDTTQVPVSGNVVDAEGNAVTDIGTNDPVVMDVDGLAASTQYHIKVLNPGGVEMNPPGGFIASTDEDGDLPRLTVVQDLGGIPAEAAGITLYSQGNVERQAPTPGGHTIQIIDGGGNIVHTITFNVVDGPKVFATDADSVARASFLPTEPVYAQLNQGSAGTINDGTYNVHVLSDLNSVMANGDSLGEITTTATVSNGEGRVELGTYNNLGAYDIIVDIDNNGVLSVGTDLISRRPRFHPAFTIQGANSGNPIVGQICADRNGNYRDIFDPEAKDPNIRDMWGYITPNERSLVQQTIGVDKYVVTHQDSWSQNDALSDVTSGKETDPVQGFCTNETPWLIWPRQHLSSGCYDCVIDVNQNGVFDVGTDFVDNIDNQGEASCGARVADANCSSNITITSHNDNQTIAATAIQLTGNVTENPVSGQVTITSDTQSNTVNLQVIEGNFNAEVPLFNGINQLTLGFIYEDGRACSKTIYITSTSDTSTNQLFRAQLTWDGDTDMDLHLVRPDGAYTNGGGGIDDCSYTNCEVGIEEVVPNIIDWGQEGENDDPKLDVDCIACGNGIENIWMNEIPQDGTYTLYVDAFNGSETNVVVTIFVGGAQVGQVNCGSMENDTATDTCRVGTISWTGGNSGSGSFAADGTKAENF